MSRIISIGTIAFLAIFGVGCEDNYTDPLPRSDQLDWPIGLEVHPNGRFLYVVNSNFDTRYNEEHGGTISVFDLQTQKMLAGNGPYIPSFGGQIKLNTDGTKAYVTVRYENQILSLDVAENGSALGCNVPKVDGSSNLTSELATCRIQRAPDDSNGALVPSDPFGLDVLTLQSGTAEIPALQGQWTLTLDGVTVLVDATDRSPEVVASALAAGVNEMEGVSAQTDGAKLTLAGNDGQTFDATLTDTSGGHVVFEATKSDILGVSHLRGTQLTAVSIPQQDVASASLRSAEFLSGSNDVVRRPGTRDFYAAGRISRDIAVFQPYIAPGTQRVEALVDRGRITLNHLTSAVDARALAFEPDGKTLYVATRNPDALHIIDIAPANAETGEGTAHRIVASIPLDRGPSDIARLQVGDQVRLYIPCFDAGVVQVVDPATRQLVDEIELGASPYVFAVDKGEHCQPGAERCWGYVSLFDDLPRAGGRCDSNRDEPCGSVGVVDLDPTSPRYHRLIRKLY